MQKRPRGSRAQSFVHICEELLAINPRHGVSQPSFPWHMHTHLAAPRRAAHPAEKNGATLARREKKQREE